VLYDVNRDKPWEQGTQAIKAEYAYQLTSILTDNDSRSMIFGRDNLFGNTMSALGRPTAAKSGTTDSWKDIWTMGYTTDVAIGVWTGNTVADGSGPTELPAWDGIQGAGPMWQEMMLDIHQNPDYAKLLVGPDGNPMSEDFAQPPGIYKGTVCNATGNAAENGYSDHTELLVRGEGPSLPCDQLSAYQLGQLKDALKDIDVNDGKYVNDGISKVERYARATGYSSSSSGGSTGGQGDGGGSTDSSNSSDSGGQSDDGSTQIQPIDGNSSGD
jgi:membrane peptidoglycan carboxypeptidase